MGRRNNDDSPSPSSQLSQTTRQGAAPLFLSSGSRQEEPHRPGTEDVLRIRFWEPNGLKGLRMCRADSGCPKGLPSADAGLCKGPEPTSPGPGTTPTSVNLGSYGLPTLSKHG